VWSHEATMGMGTYKWEREWKRSYTRKKWKRCRSVVFDSCYFTTDKYDCPPHCRKEMYAICWPRRLLQCPLVSHSKYAEGTDRRTDRRTVTIRFPLYAGSIIIFVHVSYFVDQYWGRNSLFAAFGKSFDGSYSLTFDK